MLVLDADDVARLLEMRDAINIVAEAVSAISKGKGTYPLRLHVPLARGDALVMPGYDGDAHFGTKIVTVHPGNAALGKPGTRASYILTDARDGEPKLLCDGTALTALRTAALTGLATRRLARRDAKVLALFGAGLQAMRQLEAMLAVRPIEVVRVVGRSPERLERFVNEARAHFPGVRIESSDVRGAVDGADLVVAATTSRTPVLDGDAIMPGAHVNAIGAYRPDVRELDVKIFARGRLVVDQRDAVCKEAGDVIAAIQAGCVNVNEIAELGELAENARRSEEEITIFKTVGHAALDLFTAAELLRRSAA